MSTRDRHIGELLAQLVRAVELSLAAGEAARAAMSEILKRRPETGSLPADDASPLTFTLTPRDRQFLSAHSLRLEDR
jgi:hypothetical protein